MSVGIAKGRIVESVELSEAVVEVTIAPASAGVIVFVEAFFLESRHGHDNFT